MLCKNIYVVPDICYLSNKCIIIIIFIINDYLNVLLSSLLLIIIQLLLFQILFGRRLKEGLTASLCRRGNAVIKGFGIVWNYSNEKIKRVWSASRCTHCKPTASLALCGLESICRRASRLRSNNLSRSVSGLIITQGKTTILHIVYILYFKIYKNRKKLL